VSANALGEGIIVDFRVQDEIKRWVLSLVAPRRVRMEPNRPLVFEEVVILAGIFKAL
jgi:hypothetical protein